MRVFIFAILNGVLLYLPFSRYELWFLILPALLMLLKTPNHKHYFLAGFTFFFMSLKCVNIASIQYGGVNPFLAYALFSVFVLFLTLYQMNLPLMLWKKLSAERLWTLPIFYSLFEVIRSYLPYGGFPWLLVGEMSADMPIIKYSLRFFTVYGESLLLWYIAYFLFKRKALPLLSLLLFVFLTGLYAKHKLLKELSSAVSIKVALVQTAIPQEDKLSEKSFKKHTKEMLSLVRSALKEKPDLIVLPESAFPFFFSDEFDKDRNEMFELSFQAPLLVGLIDIREGVKPYNSAYLIKDGQLVGYYDKIRLLPIGEYVPFPFAFLKDVFSAIGGIDYTPGEIWKPLTYKDIRVATPICFEVAYWDLVKKLSKEANLIAVITNDGWFNNSDCTHQHFTWARVRALENAKFVLWINNSGDTAVIDPSGKVLKKLPYMKKGILIYEVKLLD